MKIATTLATVCLSGAILVSSMTIPRPYQPATTGLSQREFTTGPFGPFPDDQFPPQPRDDESPPIIPGLPLIPLDQFPRKHRIPPILGLSIPSVPVPRFHSERAYPPFGSLPLPTFPIPQLQSNRRAHNADIVEVEGNNARKFDGELNAHGFNAHDDSRA